MDIQVFREFLHVAETLNISESARQLHLSQPTLSNHISSLEKFLEVMLLKRGTHLELTSAGRQLVKASGPFLESFDALVESVQQAEEGRNELRIAYAYDMSSCHQNAYAFLGEFVRSCYPQGIVNRIECDITTASTALESGELDCLIVPFAPIPSDVEKGVVFEKLPALVSNRIMLWVDKNNPLAQKPFVTWEDIRALSEEKQKMKLLSDQGFNRILDQHNIEAVTRDKLERQVSNMLVPASDTVLMVDETFSKYPIFYTNADRTFIEINEPDARNEAFLAYRPNHIRPILQRLLDYLHASRQASSPA